MGGRKKRKEEGEKRGQETGMGGKRRDGKWEEGWEKIEGRKGVG